VGEPTRCQIGTSAVRRRKTPHNFWESCEEIWPVGCLPALTRSVGGPGDPWRALADRTPTESGAPMLKTEIKTAIDEHSHCVGETRHQFRLQWAALEPRWSSRSARYLLAIEVLSDSHDGPRAMHVITRASTSRAELLRLVDDALEDLLANDDSARLSGPPSVSTTRGPYRDDRPSRMTLEPSDRSGSR
jgi:hypothetical protein